MIKRDGDGGGIKRKMDRSFSDSIWRITRFQWSSGLSLSIIRACNKEHESMVSA